MDYTPEQLRKWAEMIETANELMDDRSMFLANEPARQLRAHADALEKLKVAEEALENIFFSAHDGTARTAAHTALARIRDTNA